MVESNFKPIPDQLLGTTARDLEPAPLPDATWYLAEALGDRLVSHFPTGVLIGSNHLSADTLLDGNHLSVFQIILQEGETGPEFGFSYGLLNQCQARIRMPLEAVNQNRWMYPREGAWLKPRCKGQRVNLAKVDRMKVVVQRKGPRPVRFDGALVEPGPQAILTGRGILLVYNRCNTGDPDLPPGAYTAVQVLFDPIDPAAILRRSEHPFLVPDRPFEFEGKIENVCFANGLVYFHDRWLHYHGAADKSFGACDNDP